MSIGTRAGMGRGMAAMGQNILSAVGKKVDMNFRNRYLAAQFGWKLGMSEDQASRAAAPGMARAGTSGTVAPPSASAPPTAGAPSGPTQAVGPFRLPAFDPMSTPRNMRMPSMRRSEAPAADPTLTGDASLLRRREEEFA